MSEQPNQIHLTRLQRLCKVCGCPLKHSRTVYDSKNHKDDLMAVFCINISQDTTILHPSQFCENKTVCSKSLKATSDGRVYRHRVRMQEWVQHNPNGCSVCTLPVGGSPKKSTENRGRPAAASKHTQITNIRQCSPPSLLPLMTQDSTQEKQ